MMSANIKIETSRSSQYQSDKLVGSGVVVAKSNGYYYVLTNYHVVEKGEYRTAEYSLTDYMGNQFTPTGVALMSFDKDRDLALLRFASQNDYVVVNMLNKSQNVDSTVFAVGSPDGQINAVTVGTIISVDTAPEIDGRGALKSSSGKPIKVYRHNAEIMSGSSGGMLLNENLQLVAINYAGVTNLNDNSFVYALSIPSYEAVDFLSNTVVSNLISIVN